MNPNIVMQRLDKQLSILYELKKCIQTRSNMYQVIDNIDTLTNKICLIKSQNNSIKDKVGIIMSENLQEKIMDIYKSISGGPSVNRLRNQSIDNKLTVDHKRQTLCECGSLLLEEDTYQVCSECGEVTLGTIQDTPRNSRSRSENTMQHLISWIDRLQGVETTKIHPKVIDELKNKIIDENRLPSGKLRDLSVLSCADIREHLNQLGYSKHYRNIVKISNIIYQYFGLNNETPLFSQQEKDDIISYFNKCYNAFEKIKDNDELLNKIDKDKISNLPFYPYLLYKILPNVIKDHRLNVFLAGILPQEYNTTWKNDMLWEYICQEVSGISYTETDMSSYSK